MTTKLAGKSTHFLPFNKGHNHGAGNPIGENEEYRTSYLWLEVLQKDSLLDILARFLHIEVKETKITTDTGVKYQKKETLIFPRYHQLDVVRKLITHTQHHKAGHNYLIQHSAGSGKSNSIAWLAHRLANLHDSQDEKIFHSVIVISDRTILDQQLQNTIYQSPFHLYTMRQAIEENYIKDVLANYTCYERYYQLVCTSEDDPNLPRRQTAKAIARFIELHPHNIAQKVEIIIEHFRNHTRHKIGGKAKAMVVTRSREHAVKYKLAFDKYIQDKGYKDIKSLVAFSGAITLNEFPDETFTETNMNGIKTSEIPDKFGSDAYQVLLVANKFQTGFDQPLLHTMFVDKRLAGVQAVQTLSRLNRTTIGKDDTFVLDFVNKPEDIYKAFKLYYTETPIGETADPQQLNDLSYQLYEWGFFTKEDVTQWCEIWFRQKTSLTGGEHKKLNTLLDPIVDRYKERKEPEKELFKSQLTSFRNLYLFLAQILPYQDSDLEKLYAYGRCLLKKLPRSPEAPKVDLSGDIELKYFRLEKISAGKIDLNDGEAEPLPGATAVGTRQPDKEIPLSQLINSLNDKFGTDFTLADQLFFEQIAETAMSNNSIKQAAQVNTKENFAPVLDKHLENLIIDRMEGNEKIFMEVMNNEEFRAVVFEKLLASIYESINSEH
ncbi:type I restriction enzyme subunit R domain-containing protein [Nodularia spumigena]|uniref:type I restriction enzyme subunit R domain-containing protein n=1 Tax=Nodularia spumigena TaxID=70799 RepID=UPI00232F4491|nr:DEAD/DEAH box helicase family protein [Nodularia spumigena]MDB9346186.1 DEAD/DEAH box helicase family protein [Nodularia spumigena CS-588/01]MDB9352235.1 DEAD/DEAH box helicase family protein [Nodularia spumigena CS-588/05]